MSIELQPSALGAETKNLASIVGDEAVSTREIDRIVYSRDLYPKVHLMLRQGEIPTPPDAVVWPQTVEQVSELVKWANATETPLTTISAGSGVCGGAMPVQGGVVVDMKRMDRIVELDDVSHVCRVQAGVVGQVYENYLNRHGFVGGHYPSSIYCSAIGGWLAARGAGQLSTRYGKAEDLVCGLEAVLPDGTIVNTRQTPRQATGPDFDQILVGSEGTLGIITEATMRVFPYPQTRIFQSYLLPSMGAAIDGLRRVIQRGARPAVTRLYDEMDTMLTMTALGYNVQGNLLMLIHEGDEEIVTTEAAVTHKELMGVGAEDRGTGPAEHWWDHRYKISYQQSNILINPGMVLDTIEVCTTWRNLEHLYDTMKAAMSPIAAVLAHVSHIYTEGANIYFSIVANADEEATIDRYDECWKAAMDSCIAAGGAISHHHGCGMLKQDWLEANHGGAMAIFRGLKQALDPKGILNPGKMGL